MIELFIVDLTKKLGESEEKSRILAQKKSQDFSRKEQDYQELIEELKLKLEAQEAKLAANIELPPEDSPNVSLLDPSIVADLKDELEIAQEQMANLKQINAKITSENEELNHLTHSLRLEITDLKNIITEKDEEVASYRDSARQAQEEIKLLSMEDETEINLEVAPKGNSLFSEVEDRRHIAEQQLKSSQTREKQYKALYERQALELNRIRMQNVHLMNLTSNGSGTGKFNQAFVERLQSQLQSEKDKNKDLMEKLEAEVPTEEFVKKLMRQQVYDGEKMTELSKKVTEFEGQVGKLKAENFALKMRLSQNSKENKENNEKKQQEFIVENIVFEKKKSPQKEAEDKLLREFGGLLEAKNNEADEPLKEVKINAKKKVMFQVSQSLEEDDQKGKLKKSSRKLPRPNEHKVVDADEETAKMQEQCKQQ